jgi:signal transduction histidine kinase/ActR/RegA family two-component response regulator
MTILRRSRQQVFPYLLALAGVVLAAAVRYQLGPILGGTIPVVIFTVPVALAALYGGFGPGMFCTLASAAVANYLFISPYLGFGLDLHAGVVTGVFLLIGVTISYFGHRMKTLQARLVMQRQQLAEANRELERANSRKDEFLAMLAHELRNPLAGISTAAEVLRFVRADQARVSETGDVIRRQVRHMSKLVDDLLDVSRVTRGLVRIEKVSVDLKDSLRGAVEQVRSAIEAKGQHLSVEVPDDDLCVCGDRTRLTQVLSNLLANANRYSPAGASIRVEAGLSGQHIALSVEDNGQGIDPALQPRIFDLFVQAERTVDRSEGRLGIGLALVKKIVELHDGTVAVHSAGAGQGSRFTLRLPRLLRDAGPAERQQASPPAAASDGTRILVVDDNRDAANAMALLLEAYGHTVFVEYDAAAALERARTDLLDDVILDIGLPGTDGRSLCRQLKSLPHLSGTVFIAVSGYGQDADVRASREAGFDHHFAKPVQMEALLQALRTRTELAG